MKIPHILTTMALAIASAAFAQKTSWRDTSKVVFPELKYKFNASGSHYIKASFAGQVWARYTEMNPGSKIENTPVGAYSDIGLRRLRFSLWSQLTDRLFFYTQFGQNNFSFLSKRYTGAFFHDAITEFKVAPQLSFGGGLTGWSGLSRYASPAIGSVLSLDVPLYQQATNGINDQFLRKLSIYAKGQIGKLDYRVAVTSPMTVQNSATPIPAISTESNFSLNAPRLQTQAYLFWQFFDKENNTLPYTTGTYLGKKKIFNIGAGFIHQQDAMWHLGAASDTISTDMLLLGVDAFLDMPVSKKGAAVTAYVAYNNFDFGPNYVRNAGVMNPATGTVAAEATASGAGNGFAMYGTGHTVFAQVGYKFRYNLLGGQGTLQPYVSTQFSQYEKYHQSMVMVEGGMNWLIHGTHNGKLSLNYQSRPVFDLNAAGNYVEATRKGMVTLQYQIAL